MLSYHFMGAALEGQREANGRKGNFIYLTGRNIQIGSANKQKPPNPLI
jgi:hypothetical protein